MTSISTILRAIVAPAFILTAGFAAADSDREALRIALMQPESGPEAAVSHYEMHDYRRLWASDEAAAALFAALRSAPEHGLPEARYGVDRLERMRAEALDAPAEMAAAELAMTRAALLFARDLSSGLLEPRRIDRDLHIAPPRPDEAALLARLAAAPAATLSGLAPAEPGYARLVSMLAALRALPEDAWGETAPGGATLRLGDRDPRVAALRARLVRKGDHAGAAPGADPEVFDAALEADVRAFQRRHGLNDDGAAGQRTLDAINTPLADRIGQVIVSLERARWTNRERGRRHVYVNQADFTVQLVEDGATIFEERVVVGARRHRTPEFSDEMEHLVFNPTWHVPRSIAGEEILPLLQEDPEYLAKKNMRLVSRTGDDPPDPAMTDWSLYSRADFPYAIKQAPGAGNALGRVKFMFPNAHAIYLHDTPSKSLFAKDARAFSHGCVRVQDPLRFAEMLLAPQMEDPTGRIARILDTGRETVVRLETPVPVHLDYRTAWTDEAGLWQFRDDVYGRDGRILSALLAAGVSLTPEAGG